MAIENYYEAANAEERKRSLNANKILTYTFTQGAALEKASAKALITKAQDLYVDVKYFPPAKPIKSLRDFFNATRDFFTPFRTYRFAEEDFEKNEAIIEFKAELSARNCEVYDVSKIDVPDSKGFGDNEVIRLCLKHNNG